MAEYGFNTTWEIDQSLLDGKKDFSTKPKAIEGMPEIKWFLRCCVGDKSSILRRISFHITVKSEVAVHYRIEFASIYQKDKCIFIIKHYIFLKSVLF